MLNFLVAFFIKISETLKAHISEQKQISTNSKKLSSWFLTVFHINQLKNYQKFDAYAF